jgi:capsular exopolysaccharide synthesis family protein
MIDTQTPAELVSFHSAPPLVTLDDARQRPGSASNTGPSLAHLIRIVMRQKWKLLAFIALAMMAAVVLQFTLTKLYEATAEVKIDRHSAQGVLGQEASQVSSVDDMDQIITTQVELAQSDPVLRPVAEEYKLLDQEHQLKGLDALETKRKRAAPIELKRLKVSRPPNTYLIRISYRAASPEVASQVANGIAASLVLHSNNSANRPYAEISALIAKHMAELRARMDRSARLLVQYEKDLNMVDTEQHTTILTARLEQLNTEFTTAQTDRLRKEAIMRAVTSAPSVAAARAAEADNQRSLLTDSLQRVDVARQQFATARAYYGENHPEYIKARDQLNEALAEVDTARTGTSDKATADYVQALEREKKLQTMLDETKREVNDQKQQVIEYEQLKSDAERDKATYDDLSKRNQEADVNDHFRDATVQLVASARPPFLPIFPNLPIDLAVAFILSAVLGVLAVILADSLDNTFSEPEEVAARFKLDILSSIPAVRRLPPIRSIGNTILPVETEGRNAELIMLFGEAVRILRNSIGLMSFERPIHTLLMTSANPSEGKSTASAHLALSCAQVGKKVLLIDADMRRPTVHKQFAINCETGLSEALPGSVAVNDAIVQIEGTSLYVLPAGPVTHMASDLISMGFASILAKLVRDFDLIIIDGPPMLGLAEAQEIASMVDSVLLVAKSGSTTGKAVADAIAGLMRVRANILGVVMNQVKASRSSYGYHYGYALADGSGPSNGKRA